MCTLVTGDRATAECASGSRCDLATGRETVVTCGGGATCVLELGPYSFLECAGGATCEVNCPYGPCELLCDTRSRCSCHGPYCTVRRTVATP